MNEFVLPHAYLHFLRNRRSIAMKFLRSLCAPSLSLGLLAAACSAQEVIHALTGTVRSIGASEKSLVIFQDSGRQMMFKGSGNAKVRAALQKKFGDETISAD